LPRRWSCRLPTLSADAVSQAPVRRQPRCCRRHGTGVRSCTHLDRGCDSPWSSQDRRRTRQRRIRSRWSGRRSARPTGPSWESSRAPAPAAERRA